MDASEYGESSWGARINTTGREPRRADVIPEGCPNWAKPYDVMNWYRRGLIVWKNETQRLEVLPASAAVKLLEHLLSTDIWRDEGIVITRSVSYQKRSDSPPLPKQLRKRTRRREPALAESSEPPQAPAPEKPEWITMDEERIRLRDRAALDFFAMLQANEALLRRMADEDERHEREVLGRVYSFIFRSSHKRDAEQLDPSTRLLPWAYNADMVVWACNPRRIAAS
jgi:hypothetical protein